MCDLMATGVAFSTSPSKDCARRNRIFLLPYRSPSEVVSRTFRELGWDRRLSLGPRGQEARAGRKKCGILRDLARPDQACSPLASRCASNPHGPGSSVATLVACQALFL